MDLVPILTRAESLFHRFERSVQERSKRWKSDSARVRMGTRSIVFESSLTRDCNVSNLPYRTNRPPASPRRNGPRFYFRQQGKITPAYCCICTERSKRWKSDSARVRMGTRSIVFESSLTRDCNVNELSNTMDLVPILTRAESLFHRFERSVQAIDKSLMQQYAGVIFPCCLK
jgi:hypothetical protein